MGGRIVRLWASAGFQQVLWARRPSVLDEYAHLPGVQVAGELREIGMGTSVVGVCVWGESDVDEVVDQFAPELAPGAVILIHSTVSSEYCQGLAERLATSGIRVVDAPVSTRLDADKLLTLVGGDADAVAASRTVLDAMGEPVVHLGPLGSGQRAKLMNNTLMAAQVGLASDALRLGAAFGLDAELLRSSLLFGSSSRISGMQMHEMLAGIPPDDPDSHAARDWVWKDVHSMEAELDRSGEGRDTLLLHVARAGARFVAGDETPAQSAH